MKINASSTGEDIVPLALAIHELVNRLPLTMRYPKKSRSACRRW